MQHPLPGVCLSGEAVHSVPIALSAPIGPPAATVGISAVFSKMGSFLTFGGQGEIKGDGWQKSGIDMHKDGQSLCPTLYLHLSAFAFACTGERTFFLPVMHIGINPLFCFPTPPPLAGCRWLTLNRGSLVQDPPNGWCILPFARLHITESQERVLVLGGARCSVAGGVRFLRSSVRRIGKRCGSDEGVRWTSGSSKGAEDTVAQDMRLFTTEKATSAILQRRGSTIRNGPQSAAQWDCRGGPSWRGVSRGLGGVRRGSWSGRGSEHSGEVTEDQE